MTQRPQTSAPLLLVPTSTDRLHTVLEGLVAATAFASDVGATELAFAVPQTGTLQGVIREVLGDRRTAELIRGSTQVQGLRVVLATHRAPIRRHMPVFACFTCAEHTAALAVAVSTTGLIYVPWALEEQDTFLASFPAVQRLTRRVGTGIEDA